MKIKMLLFPLVVVTLFGILFISAGPRSSIRVSGNSFLNDSTIIDIDGNSYRIVKIRNHRWMTENLRVSKFRNGDIIPEARGAKEWEAYGKAKKPAWCYYNNDPSHNAVFGKLYNWFAVSDPRGLAPEGWRVPQDRDWILLSLSCGGLQEANTLLKSKSGWVDNGNGNDDMRFNGKPGGLRWAWLTPDSDFGHKGYNAFWWSASEIDSTYAHCRFISLYPTGFFVAQNSNGDTLSRADIWNKGIGMSVRCVREGE